MYNVHTKRGIYIFAFRYESEEKSWLLFFAQPTLLTVFVQRANLLELSPFSKYQNGFFGHIEGVCRGDNHTWPCLHGPV
jgi:hypothetical protein